MEDQSEFTESEEFDKSILMSDEEKRIRDLESQLASLQIVKKQNEEALQNALKHAIEYKAINKLEYKNIKNRIRKEWENAIIEDEYQKPLEVTYDYLLRRTNESNFENKKLDNDIKIHINTLKKLKEEIDRRSNIKKRKIVYDKSRSELLQEGPLCNKTEQEMQQTLDRVIESLDNLMLLEERIYNLENISNDVKLFAKDRFINSVKTQLSNNIQSLPNIKPKLNYINSYNNSLNILHQKTPEKHPAVQSWLEKKKQQEVIKKKKTNKMRSNIYPNASTRQNDFEKSKRDFEKKMSSMKYSSSLPIL